MYINEALTKADSIDEKICNVLKNGKNFRVEAGAGSGKTYSLMKVIDWLQNNRIGEFQRRGAKIACLTFTNAAVDVINSRLQDNNCIIPSTIHSFAWSVIKQFQNSIIDFMFNNGLIPDDCQKESIKSVNYTLGKKYFDNELEVLFLGHTDIIKLFPFFLQNKKFRDILSNQYPIILIDEYQDSNKEIVDCFIKYFISERKGIQFGFFGDSWQTIYQTNNACGLIENDNLEVINKEVNFRSTQKIVDVLNKIRPDLPQRSALKENDSKIFVITTNSYTGERRDSRSFKGDLPEDILEEYVDVLKNKLQKEISENEKLKILMITHRILSTQQGYPELFEMLGDGLKEGDDELLCYIRDFIEPLRNSIIAKDTLLISEVLQTKHLTKISKKTDKKKWNDILNQINIIENKSIFEVLSIFKQNLPISYPEKINFIFDKMNEKSNDSYQNTTYSELGNVKYLEFMKAAEFISTNTMYSTDHGVKGEEYDSVLFVIGKGWNLYQFDKYMPMSLHEISETDKKSFERNRNLFYVCCSRAKKNLYLFITIELEEEFKKYLQYLVGNENLIEYDTFINQ